MKAKIKVLELSLAIGLCLAVFVGEMLDREQKNLSQELLRLHVIANSDDTQDQADKLLVRDAILEETGPWLAEVKDREEATEILKARLPEIEQVAEETLRGLGRPQVARAELKQTHFPTKEYTDFSLPAGNYDALRVTLGQGEGQNWWCVVFPPLCLAAAGDSVYETAVTNGVSEKNVSLMTEETDGYVFKFKCLEWWDSIKSFLGL